MIFVPRYKNLVGVWVWLGGWGWGGGGGGGGPRFSRNNSNKFPLAQERFYLFCHLKWNGECEKECIQRDTMTGVVAGCRQRHSQRYNEKEDALHRRHICNASPQRKYTQDGHIQFSLLQNGIYALGKAHMRSTPPLRRGRCNVAFETVPMFD